MEVTLPDLPTPIANYGPAKRAGNLVFTAGQVSAVEGREYKGKLGATLQAISAPDLLQRNAACPRRSAFETAARSLILHQLLKSVS